MAQGGALNLALSIGNMHAKGRQVWFDFNGSAFSDDGGSALLVPHVWQPGSAPSGPSSFVAANEAVPQAPGEDSTPSSMGFASDDQGDGYIDGGGSGGSDNLNALRATLVGGGNDKGGDTCLENAFARYIAELEEDASASEELDSAVRARQSEVYREADARRAEHKLQVKEMQNYIKGQMAAKEQLMEAAAKDKAREVARTAVGGGLAPILTRNAGVAEALGSTPPPPEVDESALSPRSLMVFRMRHKVTDGGLRGKGVGPLSRPQLLASLQGQIGAKESQARSRKEAELQEERRYLEHVKAEMHLHSTYARASELSKQRDLLAAWERDGHLKNLNKLKALGPAAVRQYLRDVVAPTNATAAAPAVSHSAPGSYGHGSSSTNQLQLSARLSSARSSRPGTSAGLSVGFDPRS